MTTKAREPAYPMCTHWDWRGEAAPTQSERERQQRGEQIEALHLQVEQQAARRSKSCGSTSSASTGK